MRSGIPVRFDSRDIRVIPLPFVPRWRGPPRKFVAVVTWTRTLRRDGGAGLSTEPVSVGVSPCPTVENEPENSEPIRLVLCCLWRGGRRARLVVGEKSVSPRCPRTWWGRKNTTTAGGRAKDICTRIIIMKRALTIARKPATDPKFTLRLATRSARRIHIVSDSSRTDVTKHRRERIRHGQVYHRPIETRAAFVLLVLLAFPPFLLHYDCANACGPRITRCSLKRNPSPGSPSVRPSVRVPVTVIRAGSGTKGQRVRERSAGTTAHAVNGDAQKRIPLSERADDSSVHARTYTYNDDYSARIIFRIVALCSYKSYILYYRRARNRSV